jgi:hypothetical protein
MVCKSYAEAEALFTAVAKRREKRKYFLVESEHSRDSVDLVALGLSEQ